MKSKNGGCVAARLGPHSEPRAGACHRLLALALGALLVATPLMAQDINCPPGTRQKAPGVAQCVNTSTPDSNSEQNMVTWLVGIGAAIAILAFVLNRASPGPSTPNPEFVARPDTWPLPTNLNDLFPREDRPSHTPAASGTVTDDVDLSSVPQMGVELGDFGIEFHDSQDRRVRP